MHKDLLKKYKQISLGNHSKFILSHEFWLRMTPQEWVFSIGCPTRISDTVGLLTGLGLDQRRPKHGHRTRCWLPNQNLFPFSTSATEPQLNSCLHHVAETVF